MTGKPGSGRSGGRRSGDAAEGAGKRSASTVPWIEGLARTLDKSSSERLPASGRRSVLNVHSFLRQCQPSRDGLGYRNYLGLKLSALRRRRLQHCDEHRQQFRGSRCVVLGVAACGQGTKANPGMAWRTGKDPAQSTGQRCDRRVWRQPGTDCDDLDVNDGHVRADVLAQGRPEAEGRREPRR